VLTVDTRHVSSYLFTPPIIGHPLTLANTPTCIFAQTIQRKGVL
jgi:hypothetical protein